MLNGGPYFVFGRLLLLKIRPFCFEFDKDCFSSMPNWVNLPDLPLECWSPDALSKIATKIGTPITTDRLTATMENMSYARVLVEVDVLKELIRSVHLKLPSRSSRAQRVVFEFEPKFCA